MHIYVYILSTKRIQKFVRQTLCQTTLFVATQPHRHTGFLLIYIYIYIYT